MRLGIVDQLPHAADRQVGPRHEHEVGGHQPGQDEVRGFVGSFEYRGRLRLKTASETMRRVLPSTGARATSWAAMISLAPGRLSTRTGWAHWWRVAGQAPREHVGRAARGVGDDDADGLGRGGLGWAG